MGNMTRNTLVVAKKARYVPSPTVVTLFQSQCPLGAGGYEDFRRGGRFSTSSDYCYSKENTTKWYAQVVG